MVILCGAGFSSGTLVGAASPELSLGRREIWYVPLLYPPVPPTVIQPFAVVEKSALKGHPVEGAGLPVPPGEDVGLPVPPGEDVGLPARAGGDVVCELPSIGIRTAIRIIATATMPAPAPTRILVRPARR